MGGRVDALVGVWCVGVWVDRGGHPPPGPAGARLGRAGRGWSRATTPAPRAPLPSRTRWRTSYRGSAQVTAPASTTRMTGGARPAPTCPPSLQVARESLQGGARVATDWRASRYGLAPLAAARAREPERARSFERDTCRRGSSVSRSRPPSGARENPRESGGEPEGSASSSSRLDGGTAPASGRGDLSRSRHTDSAAPLRPPPHLPLTGRSAMSWAAPGSPRSR